MRALAAGSALALAAMVVVGCGSSQPATAPPRVADAVARVAFPSAQEDREARTLAAARARLVRRCMAERGFTFPQAEPAPTETASYRRALMGSPRETATLRLPEMTVRYRSGGCYAHAMGALYGSVRRYQLLVAKRNVVRTTMGARVASDPRLTRALAGWRRCMAARGLPYASPDEARVAGISDGYCAERTALDAELTRAQDDALRELSSGQRAEAAVLARWRAAAVERARRIVSA
jgi:hypothetical protein